MLNLLKMSKYEIEKKVLNLLNSGFTDPDYHDQAIINKFYKHDISFLFNFSITFSKFNLFLSLQIILNPLPRLYFKTNLLGNSLIFISSTLSYTFNIGTHISLPNNFLLYLFMKPYFIS